MSNTIGVQHENSKWIFISVGWRLIPFLTGIVLPVLGVGALSGMASTCVKKTNLKRIVSLKKGGCVCQIETDGRGLYLVPTSGK